MESRTRKTKEETDRRRQKSRGFQDTVRQASHRSKFSSLFDFKNLTQISPFFFKDEVDPLSGWKEWKNHRHLKPNEEALLFPQPQGLPEGKLNRKRVKKRRGDQE